ncbi:MAG: KOW domain-containing RNA-binding protein [Bacillota bacterium]|nr:KOW domain-containing RNA-binding protein [Bacillota bacterium]
MELKKGLVVLAKAGRDKGSFFVVTDVKDGFIFICDGKHRPLERTKKKNPGHIALTTSVLPEHSMKTNREIRRALREFSALPPEEVMTNV